MSMWISSFPFLFIELHDQKNGFECNFMLRLSNNFRDLLQCRVFMDFEKYKYLLAHPPEIYILEVLNFNWVKIRFDI